MTPLQAFILGIVEGVTEYLPVSSTGHLILTSWALGLGQTPEQKNAINAFEIIIQAGAILAVVGLYRSSLWQMMLGMIWRAKGGRVASGSAALGAPPRGGASLVPQGAGPTAGAAPSHLQDGWILARNLIVAFLPAMVLGGLFAKHIKQWLFHPWPVVAALGIGGVAMLAIAPWQQRSIARAKLGAPPRTTLEHMTIMQASFIGLMQCAAMWPGTSRSLMTILAGLIIGLRAVQAAKFSFLLGLVTLCAASAKETLDIVKEGAEAQAQFLAHIGGWLPLIMGILAAWASAALAVDLFVTYLGKHTLAIFGWWRIGLALLVAGVLLWGGTALTLSP